MTVAEVKMWGRSIGAVSWDAARGLGAFEYDIPFRQSGIQISPLKMPLSNTIYQFPALPTETFQGLPGMLADSLPDKFGNALIDAWLARKGRLPDSFNPVERLCYMGNRAMGALEYAPSKGPSNTKSQDLNVGALVELASEILSQRGNLHGSFASPSRKKALQEILRVGTSAGGARAKAIVAWNETTNAVRSGQVDAGKGFGYWLLKFDGVSNNKDKELADAQGFGLIEYAYHKMARASGITMNECRVLHENGRNHFMTQRFDRTATGGKLHMQSLCAMEHFDFNKAGAYSYEQALQTIAKLGLPMESVEEQFRRMAFNIIARNQDDHVKNIAFLMDKSGAWSLSPAFDITYSYNPDGAWTATHQMTLNAKRDGFELDDFLAIAQNASMKRGRAKDILKEVREAVANWEHFAQDAGVDEEQIHKIGSTHRLNILR